ncbi:MAG: hypothetical protein AAFU80_09425 [Pseudomonadota bacterium]
MDQIDFTPVMDLATQYGITDAIAAIAAFSVPVPDAAILGLFAFLLIAIHRSHRRGLARTRLALEDAYTAELVTANRRAYQARGELTKLRLEMERERQKKRRLERRTPQQQHRRPRSNPIVQVHEGGQQQAQSAEVMLARLAAGEPVKAN